MLGKTEIRILISFKGTTILLQGTASLLQEVFHKITLLVLSDNLRMLEMNVKIFAEGRLQSLMYVIRVEQNHIAFHKRILFSILLQEKSSFCHDIQNELFRLTFHMNIRRF